MAFSHQNAETDLPFIPPSVKPEKLFPGLDEKTITRIEKELENPTDPKIVEYIENRLHGNKYGRYSKELFGLNNGFIYGKNGLYAIYNEDNKQTEVAEPGKFGKIKLAKHVRTHEWYILKTEQLDNPYISIHKNLLAIFQNEHRALTKVELSNEPAMTRKSSKNKKSFKGYLLMKYAKGQDVIDLINQKINKNFPMSHWPALFWLHVSIRIFEALLNKVHNHSMLHCDIKPENIKYDIARDEAHIIDFGSAREIRGESVDLPNKCIFGFNAPENFENRYTEKSEIYALSNVLEMLLRNKIPSVFVKKSDQDRQPIRYEAPVFISGKDTVFTSDQTVTAFIKRMRDESENKRPNLQEVLSFLRETYEKYAKDECYQDDILAVKQIICEASELETIRLKKAHELIKKRDQVISLTETSLGLFSNTTSTDRSEPKMPSESLHQLR